MKQKFRQQDNEYNFPYHYIPYFKSNKQGERIPSSSRNLYWGFAYLARIELFIKELLDSNANNILDVGCGDARVLNLLTQYYDHNQLKGIDLSEKGIAFAKAFNPDLDIRLDDITKAKYDEKFDSIILMEVLEHIPDEEIGSFLRGIVNNLKSDGKIFLSVPHKNRPVESKHYRHYDIKLLQSNLDLAKSNLKIVDVKYIFNQGIIYNAYLKITNNRFFKIEIFDKIFYKWFKNDYITTEDKCNGLFAIIKIEE